MNGLRSETVEIFAALEDRVDRIIQAYKRLQTRVDELEAEKSQLRDSSGEVGRLAARVAELEQERATFRERIEKLLRQLRFFEG
jgi:FtsZ-binding cell division protein ZapB